MDQDKTVYIVVDRVGAPYRVLLYQPGIRFILLTSSKVLSLQQEAAFLLSVSEGLSQLDFSALDSVTGLDMLSEAISGLFADCWATYAKRITVTSCSKK